jgi:hypothetical protein
MSVTHTPDPIVDPDRLFEGFENLMPFRVQDILLVSSLYDSFILREDGRLNELLIENGQSCPPVCIHIARNVSGWL